MAVTVAGSWGNGYAVLSGFYFPFPSARPVQVPVTNTKGDWLFALVAWRQPAAGEGTTVTVSDDAHNWWEPVGAPSTDSSTSGVVRTAVWAAPAARVANSVTGVTNVQVCATGPYTALAVRIVDVSGMMPWYQATAVTTGYANAATSLSLNAAAPSAQALLFAAFGADNNSVSVTPPAGWTALAGESTSNGADHTADVAVNPYYLLTSASATAAFAAASAVDLAGTVAGVLVSAPAPQQPSPDWPVTITEAAIGAGVQTPPSQLTWTDISGRALSMSMTQGRQYSLSQLSAGQGTLVLDDPDGSFIPGVITGPPRSRTGVFLADGDYHTDWQAGASLWQSWSGKPVTVARVYAGTNYTYTTDLQELVAAGVKIRVSFTPAFNPPSSADLTSITSLLATLQSHGADVQATIWHEPYFNGLTAAQYQAAVAYYAPAMHAYYPFLPCLTGPDLSGAHGSYFPTIAVDGIAVDAYPDITYASGIMSAAGAWADAQGLPLAVWEFGVSPGPNYLTGDSFGFSGGTTGNWAPGQNCTIAGSPSTARPFGTTPGAMAVTSTGGTAVAVSGSAVPASGQMQACSPGDEIMLGAWVQTAATARAAEIHASFYTSGGVFVSSVTAATLTDSAAWQPLWGTVTAPATAAYYRLAVQWSSTVAGEIHYATVMWASDSTATGFTQAQGNSFFSWLQGVMAGRLAAGKPNGDMIMFSAGLPGNRSATAILYPQDYRVAAWQAVYAALNGTSPPPGIDSGTPVRRRVIIPASPTPHYVAVNGYFHRWPWNMDSELYRGKTQTEIADAWAYATAQLNSMAVEECLLDAPHSLWPLTDPAGSTAGSNLAPGNALPLTQVTSKYGTGTSSSAVAAVTFGANSGTLKGASSGKVTVSGQSGGTSGMWQQTLAGASLAVNGYGFALQCTDPSFPLVSGGVTVECWGSADVTAALNAISGNGLFEIATPGGTFNTAQSNFTNGQPVILGHYGSDTFPTPFVAGTVYYVRDDDGNGNYNLAATPGGSVITPTSSVVTAGTITLQLAWDPVIMSLRDGKGVVAGLSVRNTDGALLLVYRSGTGTAAVVVDTSRDYRFQAQHHYSLAITQTTWRVLVSGGGIANVSGTFPAALPASFRTLCLAGVMDSTETGYACPGVFAIAGVYPGISPQVRVINRYQSALTGVTGEAACDRIERILEYAGLTGRRWLGQQSVTYEGDLCTSGQDIGGQPAASSAGNVAQSTLPGMLAVAPTGDTFYLSKLYAWNQPVRWTLGTNAAAGEIPFTPDSIATDYDPSRVVEDVQLTQLDTQAVTLPSGTTASTTMAAVAAATGKQYGGQAYQQTGYLEYDGSSQYTAGGGLNDLANWLANVYAKPANRIQSVTVSAAANSANAGSWLAWQFWAGASPGDMVAVNVRVPTAATSPLISLTARITQTRRQSVYSTGGTSATITCALDFAPEYNALTCDDPVRGLLNGSNVLPW